LSREEIRSVVDKARRSLRSSRNPLDAGDNDCRRHHEALHAAFKGWSEADYGGRFPSRDEVNQVLRQAEEFIDAVAGLVKADGFDV